MIRVEQLDPLAQCPKRKICDYDVILDTPTIQVEQCAYCGRKVDFRKDEKTGRIDNNKYQRVNIRKFIQPYGDMKGLFHYLYGEEPIKQNRKYGADKLKAQKQKEALSSEARDYAKYLYRTGNEK